MNRILVVGCLPGINGITTCVSNLYRHLDRTQFEWEFLVASSAQESELGFDVLEALGAPIHRIDYTRKAYPRKARRQLKELMLSIPGLCGVHLHDVGMLNVYPLYVAQQLDLPIRVIQAHASGSGESSSPVISNQMLAARRRMIAGDSVDRLACCTKAGIYAYHSLPFTFFPNATDFDRFSFNPVYRKLVRSKLQIPEEAPVIGFPGHFWRRKNPLFAVKVFEEYHRLQPSSHVLFMGDGYYRHDAYGMCKDAGLLPYTHFLGYRPDMELFLNAMDLMLCTSFSEGLPNVLIEAQATGLPCLVSDSVSSEACVTGLCERLSLKMAPSVWAQRITQVLSRGTTRRSYHSELKEAGFDIADSAVALAELYRTRLMA